MAETHLKDPRLRDETRDPPGVAPAELTDEKPRGTPLPGALGVLRRNPIKAGVGAIAVVAALAAGVVWYLHARHYESSDDAFVDGRPVYVELQVSGVIEAAPVTDNQIVKAGDLLVRRAGLENLDRTISGFSA